MIFNLKKSQIYNAVVFDRLFPQWLLRIYKVFFFVLGSLPLAAFIIHSAGQNIDSSWLNIGWTYIFFPLGFSVLFFELFGIYYLKYPKLGNSNNVAELLEFEAADVFDLAFQLSKKRGEKSLSGKVLLATLINYKASTKVLRRLVPDINVVGKKLLADLGLNTKLGIVLGGVSGEISSDVEKILEDALKIKEKHEGYRISILDILAALSEDSSEFKKFLMSRDLDHNDLEEFAHWYETIWSFWREYRKFWSYENLLRRPPVGKDWIYGYSPHLSSYSTNITDKMEYARPVVRLIWRQKEIEQISDILARSGENNVILVGEEGVGKDQIITDLAESIARGKAISQLNYKKVLELNLALIAGASKEITEIQSLLISALNEAVKAGNIILILKDFHNFIGQMGGLGRIDISEIIIPYLKSSHIQVIATTDPKSFHRFIETRSELMNVFDRVNVSEPDAKQTLEIIQEAIPSVEAQSKVLVTYGALKEIVSGADKFIRSAPFPEKAFDLLSETISYSLASKRTLITKQEVDEVISRKTNVPLGPVAGQEKDKLTRLEELMHKEIIGQDRAVQVVSSTMRRLRTGLAKRGKPAGVFLFVGPTGVGKTLTAKILAKTYFGSAERMLRFDMSEYQDLASLDRFLGSTRTGEPGQFVTAVRDNPFSLILLDEIEKADKNVLNIFLQVFDEGRLTDVFGGKINFEQNIIIATSNAGADYIRDMVKEGLDPSIEKEKIVDTLVKGGYFRPELLNRFDEIVIFHPLSQDQVGTITEMLLDALASRLKEQGYIYKPSKEIADYVARAGFDPQFGARPMERVIRDKVESAIAKKILSGDIKKGEEFSLSVVDLS